MLYMLCYKLLPMTSSVVSHGLQKTTNRLLVERRDASVLLDQLLFFWRKQLPKRRRTPASQHKRRIYTTLFKCRHITKVERIRPQFIVFLSTPTHPEKHSKLCLIQS